MITDTNLRFISEKIRELRTAVMYSMSDSPVKLPNDVVTFVKVDDEGQLWFLSHLPVQSLKGYEKHFPVRLHFFRKGRNFFVEVSGKATIVNKIATSNSFESQDIIIPNAVLIKMAMSNIEYVEPHTAPTKPKWQELAQKTYQWMLGSKSFQHGKSSAFGNLHQPH